jgi:hypothetical protein
MRPIVADQGSLLCELIEGSAYGYECVEPASGDQYACKADPDGTGERWYCARVEPPWVPPCPDFRQKGDGKSGRNCWAPPADYCAGGASAAETWFCLRDGSRCCLSRDTCFKCGWIDVGNCLDHEAGRNLDFALCDAIRAKLPPGLARCMDADGTEGCDPGPTDPGCVDLDTSLVICP